MRITHLFHKYVIFKEMDGWIVWCSFDGSQSLLKLVFAVCVQEHLFTKLNCTNFLDTSVSIDLRIR